MNRYIQKIFAAGLGVMAIALCAPAQTALAAVNETVETEAAGDSAAKADPVLAAPIPVVEATGYDSVTVTWEMTDQAVKYVLQQSTDKKHYKTVAARKAGQEMCYTASGLHTAQNYYYRLQ